MMADKDINTTTTSENVEEKKNRKKIIEVPNIEILDDTPEEVKLDYYFKLSAKKRVELENLKLDVKDIKKDIKEAGFETARLVDAIKYRAGDGVNKKAVEADIIDNYMLELEKSEKNENNIFEGLDTKLLRLMELEEELKEEIKSVSDKMGEVGLEKKAVNKIVDKLIEEQNPNKKIKKPDIVLEETLENYSKTLNKSIIDISPIPINKID
jgi:uncharacterized protein (UPF0335 family)